MVIQEDVQGENNVSEDGNELSPEKFDSKVGDIENIAGATS
jgi:hypothetical protein